jgi:hypothetical protein
MATGGRLPKEILRARAEAHMSPEEAANYVDNYSTGGYFNGRKQYGEGDYSIYPTQPTTYTTSTNTDTPYLNLDPTILMGGNSSIANGDAEITLPEQGITPMHWSWNPKEESKSNDSKKKENKYSEYSPADIAAAALQLAGPAHQFFQKKPKPFQYQKAQPTQLDPSTAIMLADQALKESEAGAGYAIRQASPTSGSYLANIRANALDFGKKRGQSSAGIRGQYDLQNAGIKNQFEQYNTELKNKAIDAMQQDKANWQEQRTNALYNAGANIAGMRKDFKAGEIDKTIANNIGTTNYRLSPDGKTITYVNSNGKTVTVPAQTVTANTTQNTTTTADASTDSGTTADAFTIPSELKTGDETKAFQDFLDASSIPWYKGSKLGKGKGYGTFGPNTKAAYDKYKELYAEKQRQNLTK